MTNIARMLGRHLLTCLCGLAIMGCGDDGPTCNPPEVEPPEQVARPVTYEAGGALLTVEPDRCVRVTVTDGRVGVGPSAPDRACVIARDGERVSLAVDRAPAAVLVEPAWLRASDCRCPLTCP